MKFASDSPQFSYVELTLSLGFIVVLKVRVPTFQSLTVKSSFVVVPTSNFILQKNKPIQNQSSNSHEHKTFFSSFKPNFLEFFSQKETISHHSPLTL
ncbi:hypothetical protein [Leptospira noguchii]|uniref:Uncharacterized protein n=2 Tax=Leptospira noguchii TaxID=28182 RepID=A0AAE9GBW4_9LEPT|nr:hypothetical protein [Leptospira noguchii]UOG31149.1 hypothetical protein MAL06_03580 [Leptospira noguchii]UOG34782.1 hypothetical protein MAL02_03240 [Leptospira noguchii]UOG45675.1 hypothetical protein MAL01_03330 [Leptospira noguchii]UOG53298.1 hypothetical protein MAL09_03695 [Leptospira noguchii]UOG57259.1 hypothetical protein MAL03_03520 [Leptospira noguchii]